MKKVVILCIILLIVGCTKEEEINNNYVNEELEFSLNLPVGWEEDFKAQKDGNSVNFYYGQHNEPLFQIIRYHGMDITEEDIEKLTGNARILFQDFDVTYIGTTVYEIEEGDEGREAPQVLGDMGKIFDSFNSTLKAPIEDEDKPFKFRYVGSLFYEGYLPNYFNSRPSQTKPMTWEFTLQDKVQGEISFIPFGSGTPELVEEDIYVAFKKDNALRREVRVAFTKEFIEEFNFQIFVNSIRFLPGPENSVDIMSKIRDNSRSGETPELLKISGLTGNAIKTDKGSIPTADPCFIVPFGPPEYDSLKTYLYYTDCQSFFNSEEFRNYKEKTFFVAFNSKGEVVGLVADLHQEAEEAKEEDGN